MKFVHRFFKIDVYNLPTQEVRAIGQKLDGLLGSDVAAFFPRSFNTAAFHCDGTINVDQHLL